MGRITFLGAAGTVTGSRFLVEGEAGRILVDCGLFQGGRALKERNWRRLRTGPLDAVVLTHAHLDHCGYLPRLVRDGFGGPVHCTAPTADLAPILLRDAARLEEEDARRRFEQGDEGAVPLFDGDDADDAIRLLRGHPHDTEVPVAPGITVRFVRSGHILGSACADLVVDGTRLVITGDLGRYGAPLLRDPEPIRHADALVIESTYGDRDHPPEPAEALAKVIDGVVARRGVLLVPAFAVGRTQEVLYVLRGLEEDGRIPHLPVFVDSPMATDVTELFHRHPDELDEEQVRRMAAGTSRISTTTSSTVFTRDQAESKALNQLTGPAVVLSASGMCTGGRILHHLRHRLPDERNTVCFVGYMPLGTLGRRLLDGATEVRIHGVDLPVRASIAHVNGLSAHADRTELARWLDGLAAPPRHTWVVHGEPTAAAALAQHVEGRGWAVSVPAHGATAELPQPRDTAHTTPR